MPSMFVFQERLAIGQKVLPLNSNGKTQDSVFPADDKTMRWKTFEFLGSKVRFCFSSFFICLREPSSNSTYDISELLLISLGSHNL